LFLTIFVFIFGSFKTLDTKPWNMNLAQNIHQLENILSRESDFGVIMNFFMDKVTDDPNILAQSERLEKHPSLPEILQEIVSTIFTQLFPGTNPPKMSELYLLQVADTDFYHGCMRLGNGLGNFFFYENSGMGMIGLAPDITKDTWFSRITLKPMPQKMSFNVSMN
jgi:hypothetical protein